MSKSAGRINKADLSTCLIYGATGYTGALISRHAHALGYRPILAGRSAHKLEPLAKELGLRHRPFALDHPSAVDEALGDVDLVLHCAGPFVHTAKPMLDACLNSNTHYMDITGEFQVLEACAQRNDEAIAAGIVVLPGAGFDVVPSDCLAAHLSGRLKSADQLHMALQSRGGRLSHGTATTMVENLGQPNTIRKDGVLTPVRMGSRRRDVDFGRGARSTLGIPWGDIATAFYSTGIPTIEIYLSMPKSSIRGARISGYLGPLLRSRVVHAIAQRKVDAGPSGATAEARNSAEIQIWGEVRRGHEVAQSILRLGDGYDLTAQTAVEMAQHLIAQKLAPGFYTPSQLFGADFILQFEGVERTDLA